MFNNKTILITGAAKGIGKLLAMKFSDFNCQILIADIDEVSLMSFEKEVSAKKLKATFHFFVLDLTQIEKVNQFAQMIISKFNVVDILVNNAGVVSGDYLTKLTDVKIMSTFMVNSISPIILSREFIKGMLERNSGHIINISSASAFVGVPKMCDYSASKAAILNFDESLRLELKSLSSEVRTTVICPFYINTGMFDGVKTRFPMLLPILAPEYVVDKIYQALVKKQQRVILPIFVFSIFLIKLLPPKIFDYLVSFFGINSSMEDFKGRRAK